MNNKISKFFFTIFVLLLPWQARLILFPGKPEFSGFSIYLSEIFLWLASALWLITANRKKIKPPFVLMFLCFYVLASIFWSSDKIAAFRIWLYVFEGTMVYLYLKNQTEARLAAAHIFLTSLFIASVFGIFQFFNFGSPAWKWLGLAERGAWNLGDIVLESAAGRWLRAYGPFPHPNIFGGYLAAGILLLSRLKSKLYIMMRPRDNIYFYIFGGVFFFALFLTFSRSAWLALAVASIYLIFKSYKNNIFTECCATAQHSVNSKKENILKFFMFLSALAIIFSFIFAPLAKTRISAESRLEEKSNTERIASWRDGLAIWKKNLFFGSGSTIGHQVANGYLVANSFQPAHNIFILVLAELGIVGFAIYLFLWRGFWKNPALRPLLILFFIIGMLDHYLWTLYSGNMLFWLGLGQFLNENS